MVIRVVLALSLLACSGVKLPGSPADSGEESVVVVAEARKTLMIWEVAYEDDRLLVKAGSEQGIILDSTLTLLGPPVAGTKNRSVAGSARVKEVGPDLTLIELIRIGDTWPEAARQQLPSDAAVLAGLPEYVPGSPIAGRPRQGATDVRAPTRAAAPASQPVSEPASEAASEPASRVVVPTDLVSGSAEDRIDALGRYEKDSSMTAAIVQVMKTDASAEVRFKAWRVVRARWKRGTGHPAPHEAATNWLSVNGDVKSRREAVELLGDESVNLGAAGARLDDVDSGVRETAAHAVAKIGNRSGKRDAARDLLRERQGKETDRGVADEIRDALEDL